MLDERFKALKETLSPDLWPEIERREPRPAGRQLPWARVGTVVVASILAITGMAFAVRAFLGQPMEEALPPRELPIDPRVTATVEVAPQAELLAVATGEGSVWVLAHFPDEPPHIRLEKIDPTTNEVVAEMAIGATGEDLAVGFGSVWVSTFRRNEGPLLLRVDASTNEIVAEIPGAGGRPLAAHGSVWAVGTAENRPPGTVVRVDPATSQVVAEIPVPIEPPPFDIVAGADSVWVLGFDPNGRPDGLNIARIDPATDTVVESIDLDPSGMWMVAGGGYVWIPTWLHEFEEVGTGSGDRPVVARVDERTGAVEPEPIEIEHFRPFAFGEGGVWFINWPQEESGGICRLNATTLEADVCVEPPSLAPVHDDWAALDPETSSIWVVGDDGTVARIDLRP